MLGIPLEELLINLFLVYLHNIFPDYPKAQLGLFQGLERAFFRVSVARTATDKPPWTGL